MTKEQAVKELEEASKKYLEAIERAKEAGVYDEMYENNPNLMRPGEKMSEYYKRIGQ
jgi:hypothetical protein